MAQPAKYRIPPTSQLKLGAAQTQPLQVNFCKNPRCDNFGITAKEEPIKPGPNPNRDIHYKVTNTAKGRIPAILCKSCKEKIPIKSNAGISAEFERITRSILTTTEKLVCKTAKCPNFGCSVGTHPERYSKAGFHSVTGEQLYLCKACKKRILASDPVRIHHKTQHLASDLFSRVANKSPVRGTIRGMSIKSTDTYYSILDFISRRCNLLSGKFDRRMINGEVLLPKTLKLSVDVQEYQLSWTNKHDRRNAQFSTVCSVDQDTRYILGMCANYDKEADSFLINKEASLNGDALKPEAFRQYAQYWLTSDELLGGRKLGQRLGFTKSQDVLQQIADIYASAQSRQDIEDREHQHMDLAYCNPILTEGMQVHVPYTYYAHFQMIHMLVKGAGVEQLFYYMDCDSMLRAGFISAFEQEIRTGDVHGFYVRYSKYLTTPKKADLYEKAKQTLSDYTANLPKEKQEQAELLLMHDRIKAAAHIWKWKDKWVTHPIPSMNEPDKAICWLTERSDKNYDDMTKAQMHLDAGINAVDNIFQI
ncbi:MAG: hypothetical protein KZQ96_20645 [Candidatus Thiodiazotropha sp. (ex Lucinoma borealis)]|nr:hypothetical protein [Candidatus Thiodiazotropha sp. (ex Lucinoma borealis)]